jgi:hypothetical protein
LELLFCWQGFDEEKAERLKKPPILVGRRLNQLISLKDPKIAYKRGKIVPIKP